VTTASLAGSAQPETVPSPQKRKTWDVKLIAIIVVVIVVAVVIIGAIAVNMNGSDSDLITRSTNDLILPLDEMGSGTGWIKDSDPGEQLTFPNYVQISSVKYSYPNSYGTGIVETVEIHVMRYSSLDDAKSAFGYQYNYTNELIPLESAGVGTDSFEYSFNDVAFFLTFYKQNILVIIYGLNSNMGAMEYYAGMQLDRIN
jgi:hypothetical protein